jgi:hypothetical protein
MYRVVLFNKKGRKYRNYRIPRETGYEGRSSKTQNTDFKRYWDTPYIVSTDVFRI